MHTDITLRCVAAIEAPQTLLHCLLDDQPMLLQGHLKSLSLWQARQKNLPENHINLEIADVGPLTFSCSSVLHLLDPQSPS